MIFASFRKKAVDIEPLKTQAENRLDITDPFSSFEGLEETTIPHIILQTATESQRFL